MNPKPLGPLGVAALGFLNERPMHPYEMYQLAVLRQEVRVVKASAGSLYRAVYALERDGYVRDVGTDRDGARPERTTFEITDAGRDALAGRLIEMLSTPVDEFPEFALAIAEAHNLTREHVIELLRERLVAKRRDIAETEERVAEVESRNVPRVYWMNVGYSQAVANAEVVWIEQTLAELESGSLPWHEPDHHHCSMSHVHDPDDAHQAHESHLHASHVHPTHTPGSPEQETAQRPSPATLPSG